MFFQHKFINSCDKRVYLVLKLEGKRIYKKHAMSFSFKKKLIRHD